MIQQADGASELLSKCCFQSSLPLIRSMMECSFSIDYILKEDYESRSAAWLVGSYLNNLKQAKSFDLTCDKGRENQKIFNDDVTGGFSITDYFNPTTVKEEIQKYENQLGKKKFAEIRKKFTIIRKGKKIKLDWFQINKGPYNRRELAIYLNRLVEYEVQYKHYSSVTHSHDSTSFIEPIGGILVYSKMRSHTKLDYLYHTLSAYLVGANIKIGGKLRPSELIRKKIQKLYLKYHPESKKQ